MKNEAEALDKRIIELKQKRSRELVLLKSHLQTTYESLAPINLIKSTLKEVSSSPEIKSNLISSAVGIGSGLLFKKLWVGKSHNPVKIIFGTLLEFAIANVISKHPEGIKSVGGNLLQRYLSRRKESKHELQESDSNEPE